MAKKKLLGIFSKNPLIWFHYILLVGVLFVAFFGLNYLGIVQMDSELSVQKWIVLFIWYYAFISIGDQIIHKIIGVD